MSGSPPRKGLRQCVHVGSNVTLNFRLFSVHKQRSSDIDGLHDEDCEPFLQINEAIPRGTQTADKDEEPQAEVASELRRVKKELENAENVIAHLSERVDTYRYRWLEEYYRADNLERHMPCDVHVPVLGQIPEGMVSPAFFPELFTWNEASERGDGQLLERQSTKSTAPGEGENDGAEQNLLGDKNIGE
ncbi:uncharacterized protein F5891DRAFT_1187172 [Suillus fuscotomentosus]|uniref:Uncharacterized protein n=1 Tax=Suillus fuscotomentosus TaxID=1912939 RepID=A0AAD4E988_9AGAM|nr:uncharacterized protein F5891DRAFT_1187172 [Suillus fuscotomentosus]KAG1901712.1 hypothetical protein F5891DRAFT_1187172 [Suillus fuscotomentosus]